MLGGPRSDGGEMFYPILPNTKLRLSGGGERETRGNSRRVSICFFLVVVQQRNVH